MGNTEFTNICKKLVAKYFNEHSEKIKINPEKVYVVWLSKVLENNKALLSTPIMDGMYYEITYNGDKHEIYLDAYRKKENNAFNADEVLEELGDSEINSRF